MLKNILIVEDNKNYREMLSEVLSEAGFQVLSAENGRSAIKIFDKQKYKINAVLLDLLMPDMPGMVVYDFLTNQLKSKVPVIVLTNITNSNLHGEYIKAVLIKSNVSLAEVVSTVKKFSSF